MSTENSVTQGTPLKRSDKKIIRNEVVVAAQRTGKRAFQYAWDGDQKVQITGFPNGRATIEKVTAAGVSVEPRKLLLAAGVPARWVGVGSAVLVVALEVLRVVA